MNYRTENIHIFVDDIRDLADVWPDGYRFTTMMFRSYEALLGFIRAIGIAQFTHIVQTISLDNDMGEGYMEGQEFMKRFEEMLVDYQGGDIFPDPIEFVVHSQNPIAAKEIKARANDITKYWNMRWGDNG